MGTRNVTIVKLDSKIKIAQYGQWDGYPSGQGLTVLEFLKENNIGSFKKVLKNQVRWLIGKAKQTLTDYYKEIGVEGQWISMDKAELVKQKFPLLSRDNGAAVLGMIMELSKTEDKLYIINESVYAKDGFGCEWCYVIDLDTNTLEVYNGNIGGEPLKSYNIDNLPTEEIFVEELESLHEA